MNCEFRFLIKSENYAIGVYILTLLDNCSMSGTKEHSVCFHSMSGHLVKGLEVGRFFSINLGETSV